MVYGSGEMMKWCSCSCSSSYFFMHKVLSTMANAYHKTRWLSFSVTTSSFHGCVNHDCSFPMYLGYDERPE